MSKELVISSNRHETKVAILEDDQLTEVYFQRANEYSLASSIHKGRVTRVLPGMQSAFVNIGLERDAFLYVSDFFEEGEDYEAISVDEPRSKERQAAEPREERPGRERRGRRERGGRGERPERSDRPERADREVAPAPAVLAPVDDEETEAVAESSETVAAAASPVRSDSARSDDDRRGRRSRRRRRGGRGIPESKYADPASGDDELDAAAEPELEAEADDSPSIDEPLILPGESLAKYSGAVSAASVMALSHDPTEDSAESFEAAADPDADDEEASRARVELASALLDRPADLTVSSVEALEDRIAESDEDDATDDLDDEPVAAAEEDEEDDDTPLARVEALIDEEDVDEEPEPAAEERKLSVFEELVRDVDSRLSRREQEDHAIDAAMISEAEAETEAEAEVRARAFGLLDDEESDEASDEEPRSAEVREGSGTLPHRGTRRSRRRRGRDRGTAAEPTSASVVEGRSEESLRLPRLDAEPGVDEQPRTETSEREPRAERTHRRERRERPDRGERTERPEREENRDRDDRRERRDRPERERVMPNISDLLKEGQEIIVQIAKEPLGQKGARITSHIALPGRYVVYMPTLDHLGVSRKIGTDEERARLKKILQQHRQGIPGGFITRTAAEGRSEEEIAADVNYLFNLWLDIRQKAEKRPAPLLLHHDLDLVQRVLRDQLSEDFKTIWVDNEDLYENVLRFLQRFQSSLVPRVKMYTRSAPIFEAFGITLELEKALRPKVWLKSGGYIVINQTEALVAIDINTGKYVGKQNNRLEDTIVKTNLEAVKEIVRQIRLRDLGGIIVVDFIDMDERKNRQKVMQALEESMRADRAPYKILQFNDFGLVAITRKRVKQSLERTLCMPCPHCEGAGYIKSIQTVIGEILTEAQKLAKVVEHDDIILRVHPDVAKVLKSRENLFLEEIESTLGRPVLVKGDLQIHHEKFDLS